jgi:hypothetical protein
VDVTVTAPGGTSQRGAGDRFTYTHTLSVSKGGAGSGIVTSEPTAIDCGGTCSAQFLDGTSVTLSAAPQAGSTFAGWSPGGCSGTSTCTVNLTADTTVTAVFALFGQKVLTVQPCGKDGCYSSGFGGTVTSSPAGLDCGADCIAGFAAGTTVTLTASPAPGATFLG